LLFQGHPEDFKVPTWGKKPHHIQFKGLLKGAGTRLVGCLSATIVPEPPGRQGNCSSRKGAEDVKMWGANAIQRQDPF